MTNKGWPPQEYLREERKKLRFVFFFFNLDFGRKLTFWQQHSGFSKTSELACSKKHLYELEFLIQLQTDH